MEKNQSNYHYGVPTFKKLDFLRWVSKNQEMVYREAKWLIAFLLANPTLVEKFEFVMNGEMYKTKNAMVLSAYNPEQKENITKLFDRGFLYFKEGVLLKEVQMIIKEIELLTEPLYVEINYKGFDTCTNYIHIVSTKEESLTDEQHQEVEKLLLHVGEMNQMNHLLKQIDESLVSGNKEKFIRLTKRLNEKNKK